MWTFCAIDPETKIVPSFKVGKRDLPTANAFVADVASRMRNRVQISSDASAAEAVRAAIVQEFRRRGTAAEENEETWKAETAEGGSNGTHRACAVHWRGFESDGSQSQGRKYQLVRMDSEDYPCRNLIKAVTNPKASKSK